MTMGGVADGPVVGPMQQDRTPVAARFRLRSGVPVDPYRLVRDRRRFPYVIRMGPLRRPPISQWGADSSRQRQAEPPRQCRGEPVGIGNINGGTAESGARQDTDPVVDR